MCDTAVRTLHPAEAGNETLYYETSWPRNDIMFRMSNSRSFIKCLGQLVIIYQWFLHSNFLLDGGDLFFGGRLNSWWHNGSNASDCNSKLFYNILSSKFEGNIFFQNSTQRSKQVNCLSLYVYEWVCTSGCRSVKKIL